MATQTTNAASNIANRIPTTMRAVVYRGINDMRVETVPVPAIGPGELLVKVATCGICGTDLKKIHTGSHSAPRIFGHEMSGTVVAVGQGVTRYQGGERVVVSPSCSLRRVLLLPQRHTRAVSALQKGWRYGGFRTVRRRLRGVYSRDGLGGLELRRGSHS